MTDMVLLGDEAVALAAVHAGITAAYAYPGTPSTEILETLIKSPRQAAASTPPGAPTRRPPTRRRSASSFAGRRALVVDEARRPERRGRPVHELGARRDQRRPRRRRRRRPRHAQLAERAGHAATTPTSRASSASSRPTQQEAYDMTREAFDLSERFRMPVLVRLVTRLAHSRARRPRARAARREPDRARRRCRPRGSCCPPTRGGSGATCSTGRPQFLRVVRERARYNHAAPERRPPRPRRHHDRHRAQLLPRERATNSATSRRTCTSARTRCPPDLVRRLRGAREPGARARGRLPVRRAAAARHRAAGRRDPRQGIGHVPPDGELTPDIVRARARPARARRRGRAEA